MRHCCKRNNTQIGSALRRVLCTNSETETATATSIPIPIPPDEDVEINDRGEFINLFYEVRATFVTNVLAAMQARIRFVFVIVFIVFSTSSLRKVPTERYSLVTQ